MSDLGNCTEQFSVFVMINLAQIARLMVGCRIKSDGTISNMRIGRIGNHHGLVATGTPGYNQIGTGKNMGCS